MCFFGVSNQFVVLSLQLKYKEPTNAHIHVLSMHVQKFYNYGKYAEKYLEGPKACVEKKPDGFIWLLHVGSLNRNSIVAQ